MAVAAETSGRAWLVQADTQMNNQEHSPSDRQQISFPTDRNAFIDSSWQLPGRGFPFCPNDFPLPPMNRESPRFFRSLLSPVILAFAGSVDAAPPANDNFVDAATVATGAATLNGSTIESTREADEPIYVYSDQSVWYQWTAPAAGWKQVSVAATSTGGGNFPAVAVLQGTSLTGLSLISVDAVSGAMARFEAVTGTKYYFHITEQNNPGSFVLKLTDTTAPASPGNDSFAGAATLPSALPASVAGTYVDATVEAREPGVYDFGARATVWYRWVAPAGAGLVDFYIEDCPEACGLKLYTGTTIENLAPVAPRFLDLAYPDSYYQVTPGTVYYIQTYQDLAATSGFTLYAECLPQLSPLANDAFASRVDLGGMAAVTRSGDDNIESTTEPGEPLPVPSLTSTVWYSWTAPATGAVEIKTTGPDSQDTYLAVYTGSILTDLALRANNDDVDADAQDYNSRVILPAVAGTTYQIQIGSAYAAWDSFTLTINPVDADLLPFRILNFTASASSADVTSTPVPLTFDVTLSDPVDDPETLFLSLKLPAEVPAWGGNFPLRLLPDQGAPVLVSDTTYRFSVTLPTGLPAGAYPVLVDIFDTTGGLNDGYASYGDDGRVALPGSLSSLAVVNNGTLTPAPALTGFTLTPPNVDTTAADAEVTVSVQATGVPTDLPVTLILTNPLGDFASVIPPPLLHDGTSWKTTLTVLKGSKPQVLRPTIVLAGDTLGRDFGYSNPEASPLPAGSPSALTISNASPDRLPPQLRDFTLNETSANLSAGNVLITGTLRITDQSRLLTLTMGIDDGAATYYPDFVQSRVSGTEVDGIYTWALLIDRLTPSGTYSVVVTPDDGLGNVIDLSPVFASFPVGLPFLVTVSHTGMESAEVEWMALQDFSAITGDDALTATAINADPDHDGIPNLLEFYYGTNPADKTNAVGLGNLPRFSATGGGIRIDFGLSAANAALGLPGSTLIGQFSKDLKSWTAVPITSPSAGFFRIDSPADAGPLGFLRLKAAPIP